MTGVGEEHTLYTEGTSCDQERATGNEATVLDPIGEEGQGQSDDICDCIGWDGEELGV